VVTGVETQHIEFGAHTFGCAEVSEPSRDRDVFCSTDIKSELISGRCAPSASQPVKIGDLQ
jgi:hypothetical protein